MIVRLRPHLHHLHQDNLLSVGGSDCWSCEVSDCGDEFGELAVGGFALEVDDLEDITRSGLVEDGSRSFYINMLD